MTQGVRSLRRAEFLSSTRQDLLLCRAPLRKGRTRQARVKALLPDDVCDRSNWHLFGEYGIHPMARLWWQREFG